MLAEFVYPVNAKGIGVGGKENQDSDYRGNDYLVFFSIHVGESPKGLFL